MTTEKRLYRSRNALVGGVCAGMAEYFNFDPLVARILAVALALSTFGLCAVAYVALWAVLPLAPHDAGPVEVEPQSVESDTYGQVDYGFARIRVDDAARAAAEMAAARQHLPFDAYAGTGHAPPEPPTPEAAAWAHQARCQVPPPAWQAPGWNAPSWQAPVSADRPVAGPGQAPPGNGENPQPAPQRPQATPTGGEHPAKQTAASAKAGEPSGAAAAAAQPAPQAAAPERAQRSGGVKAAVFFGSLLLFFGIAALLGEHIDGVSWWQFWPLVFAIVGIMQMVVPGAPGHRMGQFVDGLMLFCLGSALLPLSLGAVSWITVQLMFMNLWPLLLMMAGFFILGAALRAPWWTLAAGLCFALFSLGGLLWFAVPGPNDFIVLTLPFGREFTFPFDLAAALFH